MKATPLETAVDKKGNVKEGLYRALCSYCRNELGRFANMFWGKENEPVFYCHRCSPYGEQDFRRLENHVMAVKAKDKVHALENNRESARFVFTDNDPATQYTLRIDMDPKTKIRHLRKELRKAERELNPKPKKRKRAKRAPVSRKRRAPVSGGPAPAGND